MSNTIFVNNDSVVDLQQYGKMENAKVVISGTDFKFIFPGNKEVNVVNGALFSSLDKNSVTFKFQGTIISGQDLLKSVDLSNLELERLDSALSDQRQEHVLKDNIGKLSDVDAKSIEEAKKEAAQLKQEAEKMRAEAEEARKASEDVERQLEEFLNDKAQNNTQNGATPQSDIEGQEGGNLYKKKYVDESVAEASRLQFSDYSSSSSSSSSSKSSDSTPVDQKPIDISLKLDEASDSGTKNDNITNITTPLFVGSTEPGLTVALRIDGIVVAVTVADAMGNFSFTSSFLPDGEHTVQVDVSDGKGGSGSAKILVTIDTTIEAPTFELDDQYAIPEADRIEGENLTRFSNAKIVGEAEAGSQVSIYTNGHLLATVTVDSKGQWSYQFSGSELSEGINNIDIVATDKAGNSATTSGMITLDTIPPETPIILLDEASDTGMSQDDHLTNDKTPTLHGSAEPNSTIELYLNGYKVADVAVDAMGNWSYTLPDNKITKDGDYTIQVVASDRAGNTSSATLDITVDTNIDAFSLSMNSQSDSGIAGDNYTNNVHPSFTGKTDPSSHIVITNLMTGETIEIDASQSGNFSFTLAQASVEGNNELSITVTDYAGNQQTFTYEYTIDTIPPAAPTLELDNFVVSLSGDILTNDTTPAFTGKAEPGSTVIIYIDGKAYGSVTAGADGSWSFTMPSSMADGNHTATAYAQDLAGNISPSSAEYTFNIDTGTLAPSANLLAEDDTGISQTDWITRQNDNLSIVGTAEKYATIVLKVDGKVIGTTRADANGNWQFEYDPNPALSDGDYKLTIEARDEVGNTASSTYELVIDTITVTPSVQLDAASDTGSSSNDGITKDTHPLLTGTAEANATVEIYIDGKLVGQVVADKNGIWNYRVPEGQSLSDGDHSVMVKATDTAGNSANSTTMTVTVDSVIDTPTIQLDSDSGASSTDRITNSTLPTFSGTAEAFSTITIYEDGKAIGKATADANGKWTYTLTASQVLADGSYIFSITATDVAGNTASSEKIQVTIDTWVTTPVVDLADSSDTGSSGTDNITRDTTPTFTFSNIDADVVDVQVSINGTMYTVQKVGGVWQFTAPELPEGDYSIIVQVTDNAGNTKSSAALSFTVDTSVSLPVIILNDDTGTLGDNQTNVTTPGFAITADPDVVTVMVSIDGGVPVAATKGADGKWHITSSTLTDGDHILSVTVTDVAGNTATSSLDFTVDTTLSVPTIDLTDTSDTGSSATDNITRDNTPAFTLGNIDADVVTVQVLINGTAYDAEWVNGQWTFTAPELPDGEYSITVQVTDDAGNTKSSAALNVTVDTVTAAPVITLSDDTGVQDDNQTNDTTPGFAITTDADAVTVMVSIDGGAPVAATKDADGKWHIDSSALNDGEHTIVATVTDAAGNTATSDTLTFTVDTTLSVPTIDLTDASDTGSSTDNITRNTTPAFTLGNIDADVVTVQVLINGTAYDVEWVNGQWTFTAPELADGEYSITVQVTDDAGNTRTSAALDVTVDTVTAAPVITLSDDTGVQGDNQTNDATPGFAITTDADAVTVMVSIDGGAPVAATKDADGKWHIDSSALNDGEHTVVATVTDAAGNTATSDTLTFTVDTTLSVPTIDLTDASDTGSSTDNITRNTTPAFTLGNIDADVVTVQVLINGTAYDVEWVNGQWTFTAPELADGEYSITVQVTDDAGNTRTSAALDVTVDTVTAAPVITLSDDTGVQGDNQTNDATPGFAITTDADAVTVMVSIDGGAPVAATKDADGKWHIDSSALNDGEHTVVATVTDAAGNTATSDTLTFTVDTTLSVPTIDLTGASDTGSSATDNITRDSTPTFTLGNIDADVVRVQVLINGTAYDAQKVNGQWTFTAPELADGEYSITVQVTDDAGNTKSSAALDVTIDTVTAEPVITLSDDTGTQGDNQTNVTTPGFAITTDADAVTVMVSIDGGAPVAATKDADGKWRITSGELSDGDHTISVTVTDVAGNTATSSLTFNVDTALSVPTVDLTDQSDSGISPTDNITNDNTPTFTLGNIDADVVRVKVLINGTAYDAQKVDGQWTFTAPVLADGEYSITVQVTDDAGNTKSSAALDVTIDTTTMVPVITLSDDTGTLGDNQTSDTAPGFAITTGTDVIRVMVSIDGGAPVAATKDADGQWHITSGELSDGDHTISVTVTDVAGNTASSYLAFNVDTTLSIPTVDLSDASDTGSSSTDNITRDNTPAFTLGNIDADVVTVQVLINGTAYDAQKVDGQWTFTAPELADGEYTVTVQVTDDAGNTKSSAALNVTIDTVTAEPVITLSDDTGVAGDNQTNVTTPGFAITTDADAVTVMVSIDGGAPVAATKDADGQWHINSKDLADGEHSVSVTVTDVAGNTATSSLDFTVDTTLSVPTIDLTDASDTGSSATDNITRDSTPTFTLGNIDADVVRVQVLINGTAYDAQKVDGQWQFTAPELADGEYSITVQVTDDAGNIRTSAAREVTVDTVTAVPVITLSDDTGVQGDNQTNDATPGFAITTDADAVTVMVSIDGGAPVAATKDADGKWHIDSKELADGEHTVVATVTDAAGNTATSDTLTFTVDTTLSVPTIDLTDASDTGSSTDNITRNTTPAFTLGNIDADVVTVQVLINGTAYDVEWVNGQWTFTAPELADGEYSITVQVTDDAGNTRTSAALDVTVDTVTAAPVITLSDDTGVQGDNQTNDATPGFAITTDADAVTVMVSIDGGAPVAATKDADGKWHIDSSALNDGEHTVVATVTDAAGNTATSDTLTFTVDTTLSVPTIDLTGASDTGSSATDNITRDSTPTFTLGNIDADVVRVQVLINGTAYDAQKVNGQWTFTAPELADGEYSITVQVTDDAGNTKSSAALDVTIDTVTAEPVITLSDDTGTQGDNQTNVTTPGFAITTDADAVTVMVSIDGGAPVAATKDADGKWRITSGELSDGDHTISVTVTDVAGNTATSSLTFNVDTALSVPTVDLTDQSDSGISPTDNITNDNTPTFTLGNIDADVVRVKVLINGTAYDAQKVDGQWTFTAPVLADGEYSITVQVTDDAGNTKSSAALDVTIDTTTMVPVITLSDDTGTLGDNQTSDTAPGFAITTGTDVIRVMVSIDGGAPVAATKDADGQWHITSGELSDGDHTISVTVTDVAGNTASSYLAFNVDTTLSIPTVDLSDASDTGSSSTDNITRDNTPAFTLGNIDADVVTVQVLINGTAYDAQKVDGQWTFTAPELADGEYTVTVQVTDDAGNTKSSAALNVTIDTVTAEPVITLSDDTGVAGDNQTNVTTPGFAITTDADAVTVMVSIDGGAPVAATKDADGQWHINSKDLADGEHSVSVTVTDVAGNTATSSLDFTVDTTLSVPTIDLTDASDTGSSATDNITRDSTPTFTLGNIDADVVRVQVLINGTAYDAQKVDGQWQFTAPELADGEYSITVQVTDDAGNIRTSAAREVTVDTVTAVPVITLSDDTGVQGDNQTNDATPGFAITTDADAVTVMVSIDGGAPVAATKDADGKWHIDSKELADGEHTVVATVTDAAGNTATSDTLTFTVDTTLSVPTIDLTDASDTGSSTDNITRNTTPAFTLGNIDADVVTVQVLINGTAYDVEWVNGQWTFTAPELADGEYSITVQVTDDAGNTRTSAALDVTVDTVTAAPVITLSDDTGVQGDNQTNDATPGFAITTDADAVTVMVSIDGGAPVAATKDADGKWHIDSSALNDGEHTVVATVTDAAGNTATSDTLTFTVDTTLSVPTIDLDANSDTGGSDTDNITRDSTPTFTLGNIDADVVSVQVLINGTAYDAVLVGGKWTFTAPALADGEYTVTVQVTDDAGNTKSSAALDVTIDTATMVPVITLSDDTGTPGDNQTNVTTPGFVITTDADAVTVMVSIDGGAPVAATKDADGQWHINSKVLADGEHTLSVTVTDVAGNTVTSSLDFTVDTTLSIPTIDLTDTSDTGSSATDNITRDSTPNFTLDNIDADVVTVKVLINGTAYDAQKVDGQWQFTAPELADGEYSITVQVTDDAGNTKSSTALDVTVDTVTAVPVITLSDDTGTPGENQTNDATPGFTITTDRDAVTVMVSIDGGAPVAATKDADGQWHIKSKDLADGEHSISVTVTDVAGNTATSSLDFTVDSTLSVPTIDLTDASDTGSSATDNITRDSTPTFTLGNIDADVVTVKVLINGTAYDAQKVDGQWTFTAPVLADGEYSITVQVTDDAGNTKSSAALNVTIDTVTAEPVITLSDDTGVAGDNQTNVTTPGFAITTDADAVTVMVSIDGGAPVAATKDADGQWHIKSKELADGEHSVSVTVTDVAGNTATSSLDFTVDTTLSVPTLDLADASDTGSSSTDNITRDSTPTFTLGNIDADVVRVQVLINGTAYDVQKEDGQWTFTAPALADGEYSITVQVTDDAGNTKRSAALDVTIDTVTAAPVITLSDDTGTPGDNQTNDATPGFAITTDRDAVTVMVSIDGGAPVTATKDADGKWQINSKELADGDHSISVTVTDVAGNTATSSLDFTVDTTLSVPTIDLTDASDTGSSATDNITRDNTPTFTLGNIDADVVSVQVLINGTAYDAVLVGGKWTFTAPTLADGEYTVTVQVTDDAGNTKSSAALDMTIDTAISEPVITLNEDTGVPGDKQTNVNLPTFNIHTDADALSVMVSIDGGTPVAATKDAAGEWHIASGKLLDGDHSISVTVTDVAGNTATSSQTFTVDTTLSVPTIDLTDASDTGSSATDNITRDNTPAFTLGNIDADVTEVQVLINGTAYNAQKVDGQWTFTAPELADGDYSITVRVTDDAGNIATSTALNITIDTVVAPVTITLDKDSDTGSSSTDRYTSDTTPTFTFGNIPNDVASITLTLSNGKEYVVDLSKGSSFTLPDELADGAWTATVTVVDIAGNSAESQYNFTIDTTVAKPTVDLVAGSDSGDSQTDNLTNVTRPQFQMGAIDVNDCDTITIVIRSSDGSFEESWSVAAADYKQGLWTCPVNLGDGEYQISVTVKDVAGNQQTSDALNFEIDTKTAINNIQLLDDTGSSTTDGQTNVNTPAFSISVPADVTHVVIMIDGKAAGNASKQADGTWHFTASELTDGAHTLSVVVTDKAGNTSQQDKTFTVDTTLSVPTLSLASESDSGFSNSDNITNNVRPTFTIGNIDSDVVSVMLTINGQSWPVTITGNTGTFTVPVDLPDGIWQAQLTVTDDAGNTRTTTLSLTIDTVTSVDAIELQSDTGVLNDWMTNETKPTFAITAPADAQKVTVTVGSVSAEAVFRDGKWIVTLPSALSDGDYTLHVTVTDKAGNTADREQNFTIDTTLEPLTVHMSAKDDSGVAGDDVTNNTMPSFEFSNIPEDVYSVEVILNGVRTPITVQADGSWIFTPATALADGEYTLQAIVTDKAGNQRTTSYSFTVDTTVDINMITLTNDTGDSATDGITNASQPVFVSPPQRM
ncbi:hypothetical protein SP99_00471 [Enterobacter sp. BIDMC92]|uniref:Ig-like domain-containing protein n=1 Tax=Enterobacter sp. BIDMC92 TaxID=1594172 RepID=UPI00064D04D2|nr:Ig-like domain-containing protein [Enterobacter sp. BIDMC92]KLW90281.1 hypothetical protein SP99_00471 [Enterobacter sp. BIDMC92]